ncbi:glycosyltransferase family 2 protein [Cyclobacterium roseum]|uniref:glycosyltransferase family 2 protein n=1 Tax=Cyclobacterium roseum TaxID=2666137 RepID=UPI0013919A79|nr:glycosyltransferase [Cyclobacterium roseum]
MFAPICLFTYNRPKETLRTLQALKANSLAKDSRLFIFSDGPKKNSLADVEKVRELIEDVNGFKSVEVYLSQVNKGLSHSIIDGVSTIIEQFGKVIVLEDDLITSPNFLNFMNQALDFYSSENKIFSISGYSLDLPSLKDYPKDWYLGYRASSWGWGTWQNRWKEVDWEVKDFKKFKRNPFGQYQFMRGGSDLPWMLYKQMNGKIDSWAIRWCYNQFKNDQYTVFPSQSKVISIGFGEAASNTKKTTRFDTCLDTTQKSIFYFEKKPKMDTKLNKEFKNKFSLINRIKNRLLQFM